MNFRMLLTGLEDVQVTKMEKWSRPSGDAYLTQNCPSSKEKARKAIIMVCRKFNYLKVLERLVYFLSQGKYRFIDQNFIRVV